LTEADAQRLVLGIVRGKLTDELERRVTAHRQQVIAEVENWWDKYRVSLRGIEVDRDVTEKRLEMFMRKVGYE